MNVHFSRSRLHRSSQFWTIRIRIGNPFGIFLIDARTRWSSTPKITTHPPASPFVLISDSQPSRILFPIKFDRSKLRAITRSRSFVVNSKVMFQRDYKYPLPPLLLVRQRFFTFEKISSILFLSRNNSRRRVKMFENEASLERKRKKKRRKVLSTKLLYIEGDEEYTSFSHLLNFSSFVVMRVRELGYKKRKRL